MLIKNTVLSHDTQLERYKHIEKWNLPFTPNLPFSEAKTVIGF